MSTPAPLVPQPTKAPTRKVGAQASVTGIAAAIIAVASRYFDVTIDPDLAVAIAGVVAYVAAWFVRNRYVPSPTN